MQIAQWKTRGKDWIILHKEEGTYFYEGYQQGGRLPPEIKNDEDAIAYMERPWGVGGAGPVTVLKTDRPSLYRMGA